MKKVSFTTALVLALAISVVAQTTTPQTTTGTSAPGTTTQGQTTPGANPTSLTGCLSGPTNGVYTLRTLTDNRVYTLRSENPLASHASHAVTVTGSVDANAASSGTATTNPAATTAGAATGNMSASGAASGSGNAQTAASANAPVFTVTSISMANESCEAGSAAIGTGASTKDATGQAAGANTTASAATSATTSTAKPSSTSSTASSAYGQTAQSTTPTTAGSQTSMAGAQGTEVSGCLMASNRDAGRYFIRTTKGKKFVTEVIPDATLSANIAEHVGHQVRLTGQFTDAPAPDLTADARDLPQADQPERGKKAHEQDRNTGRQFTASNIEMISASGCPQSGTTPNRKANKPKSKGAEDDATVPKK